MDRHVADSHGAVRTGPPSGAEEVRRVRDHLRGVPVPDRAVLLAVRSPFAVSSQALVLTISASQM